MKRMILFTGSFMILGFTASLSAQSTLQANNQTITSNTLPDYPTYVDTGNPQADAENYRLAKDKWIMENQVLYNKELERMNAVHNDSNNPEILLKEEKIKAIDPK